MTMGMGFPMRMGIPRESRGNVNKTPTLEWEGLEMNVDRNGNDAYFNGTKFTRIFEDLR